MVRTTVARARAVGYTPAGGPGPRPGRAVVVLVLVLVVGAVAWFAGRGSAPDRDGDPAGTSAQAQQPAATPGTAAAPRTPEGAGEVFASYMRSHYAMTLAPVEQGERWLAEIAAPGALPRLQEKFSTKGLLNGSPSSINQFMPARIITVADPDGSVRALVWGVELRGLKSNGVTSQSQPITRWTTTVGRMVWTDGTWKLSELVSNDVGPTPTGFDDPEAANRFARVLSPSGRPAGGA